MGKREIIAIVIVVVCLAAVLLVTLQIVNHQSCTVGVTGTATSITFIGRNAASDCDGFVHSYPNNYYIVSQQPQGTEMCEGTYGVDTYVVRDTGTFFIVGNAACKMMHTNN